MNDKEDPDVKHGVRKLDGILPESIDRRQFLTGTAVTVFGGMLAGCTSDGGNGGDQTGAGQGTSDELVFQTPWKATPAYAPAHAAPQEGFWDDAGVPYVTASEGQGSGDTAKRVGTGVQQVGHSNAFSQVSGLIEGYNLTLIGAAKGSAMYGVVFRTDYMESGEDLADKTIYANSASTQSMWDIYASLTDAPDSTTLDFTEESTSLTLFGNGEIKAAYTTLNDAPAFLEQASDGHTIGINPIGRYISMYGYIMYVNSDWLSQGNNMEVATSILEGYSHAGKWCLLNPNKALNMMKEVNPGLKTASEDSLLGQMKSGVAASNLTDTIRNNGFGYLSEETVSNTFNEIGSRIEGEPPSTDEVTSYDPRDNADLATFSSEEWSQVKEFAQPFADIYAKQMMFESDNF